MSPPRTGRFITLEGSEGAGKSTALATIADWLAARNIEAEFTREPGGTDLGERVRELLLDARVTGMLPTTELLLMFAARAQHVGERILPALAAGKWVICDRFTDSSHAYQGAARGMSHDWIDQLAAMAHPGLSPSLTLLLDVPVEIGLARTRQRGGEADRFERERTAFFEQVRAGFLARAAAEPARFRVIDAGAEIEAVRAEIEAALEAFVASREARS